MMAMLRRHRVASIAFAAALAVSLARPSRAGDDLVEARSEFKRGADFARDAQWNLALAAFERSSKLKPHPWTTFNVGVCQRALGQYVRARRTFARALAERAPGSDLPESTVDDIASFVADIDRLVAVLDVTVEPATANVSVDGRPLEVTEGAGVVPTTMVADAPNGARPAPARRFTVVLDPGSHVLVVSRPGFADVVRAETLRPAESRPITMVLDRLPSTLAISADRRDAVVTVDALDVGVAPVTLERPAGSHRVLVRRPGYLPYETVTVTRAGERSELFATLREDKPGLLSRWWFWTAAGAVLVGATLTTYAVTRPEPTRPATNGGGLGWTVNVP